MKTYQDTYKEVARRAVSAEIARDIYKQVQSFVKHNEPVNLERDFNTAHVQSLVEEGMNLAVKLEKD